MCQEKPLGSCWVIVDLILLKNKNFCAQKNNFHNSQERALPHGQRWLRLHSPEQRSEQQTCWKTETFAPSKIIFINHRNVILLWMFYTRLIYKLPTLSYFFKKIGVIEVYEVFRLLQIVLFLTDSISFALCAYFDESIDFIRGGGYEP